VVTSLQPGAEIERYHVQGIIGRGGQATVYLVRHRTLETLHALKVLTVSSSTIRQRLIREGRVQARLAHPNVVPVTDVLEIDGSPGLLMPYIDGPTLAQLMATRAVAVDEAEALFRGILDGMEHAHALGVIHRDLKPSNVLLSDTPTGLVPQIADFGVAKAFESEDGSGQTRTGVAMGTPSYMAPEQIRDAKNVDLRADIFALGSILYELLCGRMAFSGDDLLDTLNAVASGSFTPPKELVADLPERLDRTIHACLSVDRDARPADCTALRDLLDGQGLLSTPPDHDDTSTFVFGLEEAQSAAQTPARPQTRSPARSPAQAPARDPGGPPATRSANIAPETPVTLMPEEPSQARKSPLLWLTPLLLLIGAGVVAIAAGWWWQSRAPIEPAPADALNLAAPAVRKDAPTPAGEPPAGETSEPAAAPVRVPPRVRATTTRSSETAETTTVKAPAVKTTTVKPPPKVRAAAVSEPVAAPMEVAESSPTTEAKLTGGRFRFTGADDVALLSSSGRRYSAGAVPAGRYDIEATLAGRTGVAGRIRIQDGDDVLLRCDADFFTCSR